jgi:hypothetical protein
MYPLNLISNQNLKRELNYLQELCITFDSCWLHWDVYCIVTLCNESYFFGLNNN